jgi:hypothetical protein
VECHKDQVHHFLYTDASVSAGLVPSLSLRANLRSRNWESGTYLPLRPVVRVSCAHSGNRVEI